MKGRKRLKSESPEKIKRLRDATCERLGKYSKQWSTSVIHHIWKTAGRQCVSKNIGWQTLKGKKTLHCLFQAGLPFPFFLMGWPTLISRKFNHQILEDI